MIRVLFAILAMVALTAVPAMSAEFNHRSHDSYLDEVDCATCHIDDAKSITPAMSVCLGCHEQPFVDQVELPTLNTHGPVWSLNHRAAAKSNSIDCASCHQQSDCLDCHAAGNGDEQGELGNNMINVHRADFRFTHVIAGRNNQQRCTSCHESRFCNDCHDQFAPEDLTIESHRKGWSSISVAGTAHDQFAADSCKSCHSDSVLPVHDWSSSHAREARKNLASCQACHPEGNTCLKCHSATSGLGINPHPSGWDDFADRLKNASSGKTCRKCH